MNFGPSGGGQAGAFHDKVAELEEVFSLLAVTDDGAAEAGCIKGLLLEVLPALTEEALENILEETRMDRIPSFTFAQFYVVFSKVRTHLGMNFTAEDAKERSELAQAFTPFDKDNSGIIDADIFMALMMEKGEKMSAREGAELRSRLERMGFMENGRVNYRAFLHHVNSSIPQ